MINFEERFAWNLNRIKTNAAAGDELAGALADTATYLARRDQAACLRSLKARVLAEVKFLLDAESSAKSGFTEGKLLFAPLSFAIGGWAGMLLHHENPVKAGLDAAGSTLSKKLPFGIVLVGIGPGGLPDDVKVIPLSALARESKMTESTIRATIVSKGYLLITPEVFAATMDETEHRVLNGDLSLPLPLNEFQKRIVLVIAGRFPAVLGK